MSVEISDANLKDIARIAREEAGRMAIAKVATRAKDILSEYGEFKENSSFKEQVIACFSSLRSPFNTREEAIYSHSVSGYVSSDQNKEPVKITLISHGKKKPSETSKISVKIPGITPDDQDMDTLLFSRKGWSIGVTLWNENKNGIFYHRAVSIKQLIIASQVLDIFHENLVKKRSEISSSKKQ